MSSWEAFHFLRPFWLLLLLPFAWIVWVLARKDQLQQQWQEIIAPHILKVLSINESDYRSFNPVSASAIAIVLMIIILAGPSWSRQHTPFSQDQSALVIMLDASSSMTQTDIQPSRLERSKQKIQDLLALRKGSKTALIVFAGSSHTVLPLSNDGEILSNYLQAIKNGIVPVTGKFPERALDNILLLDANNDAPLTILWIGDGFSSATRTAFDEYFNSHQQQLLIWGAGKTRTQLNKDDADSISPLEADGLERIAADNGGRFLAMTVDDSDVKTINRLIDRYFVATEDNFSPWQDNGYYLVFLLMPIFLLWFRRGWTLHWGFILALSLFSATPNPVYAQDNALVNFWATPDQQGHWYFYRGDYLAAADRFQDPLWKGMAYYQAEQFKQAADYFSRVDSGEGLFNLANALANDQQYLNALSVYDRLLAMQPDHRAAQTNRTIVRELVDEINRMSESQQQEGADSSKELGKDDPQRAEGADYQTFEEEQVQQLTADDIFQNQQLQEMWMRNVQPDPSNFLSNKFHMQRASPVQTQAEGQAP